MINVTLSQGDSTLPDSVPTTADFAAVKTERDRFFKNETKFRAALAAIVNVDPTSEQGKIAHDALQEGENA